MVPAPARRVECLSVKEAVDVHLARHLSKTTESANRFASALNPRVVSTELAHARLAQYLSLKAVKWDADVHLVRSSWKERDVFASKASRSSTEHARAQHPQYLSLKEDADVHPVW